MYGNNFRDQPTNISISIGSLKASAGLGYSDALEGQIHSFYEYDQESDSWTNIADYPGERKDDAIGIQI